MIRVNLLPWREQARTKIKQLYLRYLIGSVVALVVAAIGLHFYLAQSIKQQIQRNTYLQQTNSAYEKDIQQIKQVHTLQKQLATHMRIIEQLQAQRPYVVHLFASFSTIVPNGTYLTKIVREDGQLTLSGRADANSQVSQLMRNARTSPWLTEPHLKLIKSNQAQHAYKRDFDLHVKEVR